jgi:hypothetical protein
LRGRRREYAEDSRDSERRSGRYSCTWISLSELGCSRQNLFTDYFVFFLCGACLWLLA